MRFVGVDLGEAITHPVSLGVMFGLFAGKIVGISVFSWFAIKFRLGVLPRFVGWKHIVGLAAIAGIGFTVSLFITGLAFDSALLADRAKLGIFVGSFASGVVGYLILRSIRPDAAVPSP